MVYFPHKAYNVLKCAERTRTEILSFHKDARNKECYSKIALIYNAVYLLSSLFAKWCDFL